MSDFAERVFSSAKQTMTDRRTHLACDTLEAIECLKSWLHVEDFNRKMEAEERAELDEQVL